MPVICNNFYTGTISNTPLYANFLNTSNLSNISVLSDMVVNGVVSTTKHIDTGTSVFATFRLTSNQSFSAQRHEIQASSNTFIMDGTNTNMNGMSSMSMTIPSYQVYNAGTGQITVPVDGLYSIQMQGVFQNDPGFNNPKNGVYFYFQNHTYPNARTCANISASDIVSTTHIAYLLGGDKFMPTFYSNDPNAQLLASGGETYVSFNVHSAISASHSNFTRLP